MNSLPPGIPFSQDAPDLGAQDDILWMNLAR
jgi:hypothetical protein